MRIKQDVDQWEIGLRSGIRPEGREKERLEGGKEERQMFENKPKWVLIEVSVDCWK